MRQRTGLSKAHRIASFAFLIGLSVLPWYVMDSPARADSTWVRSYSGSGRWGDDFGRDVAIDANGNVYVSGYGRLGGCDGYITLRYSPVGDMLWARHYTGGVCSNWARSMDIDDNGKVIVTGQDSLSVDGGE